MQLIENGAFGVRLAEIRLRAEDKPDVTIFPMLHVADADFYVSVAAAADSHQLVLVEGAKGRAGRRLSTYRRIARRKKIGVALQSDFMNAKRFPKWRNSDLPEARLDELYDRIPLWRRLFIGVASAILFRLMSKRDHFVASIKSLEDHEVTTGRIDVAREFFGNEYASLVFDERDAALARNLDKAIAEAPRDIAVVWGANHAPRLLRRLREGHGYVVVGAEWRVALA